jgi:hypothetical protein
VIEHNHTHKARELADFESRFARFFFHVLLQGRNEFDALCQGFESFVYGHGFATPFSGSLADIRSPAAISLTEGRFTESAQNLFFIPFLRFTSSPSLFPIVTP